MAKTKIEWTATPMPDGTLAPGYTFNPWQGCAKKSTGCKNCFAESMTKRFSGAGFWGVNGKRKFQSDDYWEKPLGWDRKAEKLGIRLKVFCGSMCDVFEDREDLVETRDRLFALIDATPYLDWILLTKRPEDIKRLWPFGYYDDQFSWPNIWLGTSVENQEHDWRLDILLKVPAKFHFVSCEPLLEEINISDWLNPMYDEDTGRILDETIIDWVIVGGESGPKRRPFNPDWARSIRDQCQEADVPFFMKQIDKVKPIPDDLMIREFPK